MSSPKSALDLDVQIEEWDIRYRQLLDSLQEHQETTEIHQHHADRGEATKLLVSKAMIARAGRLGALQCAAVDRSSYQSLMNHTREDMIADNVQKFTDQWLASIVEKARTKTTAIVNSEVGSSIRRQTGDVDEFFDEYPECVRPGWNELKEDNVDEVSSSSDEDETPAHRSKRGTSDLSETAKQPKHDVLDRQEQNVAENQLQQQERPASANGRTSHPSSLASTNPYQKRSRPTGPAKVSGTQVLLNSRGQSASRFEHPSQSQSRLTPTSEWDQRGIQANHHHPSQRPTQPHAQQYPVSRTQYKSNAFSSWDDHTNQQNPFFTAREMAQIIRDDEPPQRQHTSSGEPIPYSTYQPPLQPPVSHLNTSEDHTRGGPSIPDSLRRKFQPPKRLPETVNSEANGKRKPSGFAPSAKGGVQTTRPSSSSGRKLADEEDEDELPEELQHLDKELVKKIQNEIMESGEMVTFEDIAGLEDAKQIVQEVVCWPMKRPDLFTGLRRAPNGLLLYGPPGTGKTLIGKAIAHESGATFFSISSSSLTSKWIGEGEKLVKTLFAVAAYREPAVVFIDEIDSLLTQRKSTENEASRRIKTEFLVQLDGTGTSGQGRVLLIGATNKPQELDEAARRRFTKRLYVPLPAESDRRILINVMLKKNNHQLTNNDIDRLAKDTDGFSGADLKALCTDAAMGPIRQLGPKALEVDVHDVPPITFKHFKRSLKGTKPSVAPSDLLQYEEWDTVYGSLRATEDYDDEDDEDDED